ncbi:MAG: glycosyltransferase family 2 protein [Phormidesmis sp.]
MTSSPRISVLINNYNYGRFLGDAIDSVLTQRDGFSSPERVEVVVVDDGSTDSSAAVMARYGDRIVSVKKQNGGQDSAFNAGFERCRGNIICLLDADDRFARDKLSKIADCFECYPDIGWCFHPMMLEDLRTGKTIGKTRAFPGADRNRSQHCDFREHLRFGQLPFYPTATSGQCFRRSLLAQLLPMPETFANTSADRYLRVAAVGLSPGYFLADVLTVQGIHDSNISTLRPERPSIPERQIVVAYMLRTQFPVLPPYANRLFSRGLSAYKKVMRQSRKRDGKALPPEDRTDLPFYKQPVELSGDPLACRLENYVEPGYKAMIRDYWRLCSPVEQAAIMLLRLYRKRPWRGGSLLDTHYYHFAQRQATAAKSKVAVTLPPRS